MYSRLVLCTLEDWQRVCVPRFFFFNDTATTEIYTLSLHDALPIWLGLGGQRTRCEQRGDAHHESRAHRAPPARSEEHTSELQSQSNLVCRLLLEKKTPPVSCHVRTLQFPAPGRRPHRRPGYSSLKT